MIWTSYRTWGVGQLVQGPEGKAIAVANLGSSTSTAFAVGVYMEGSPAPLAVINHAAIAADDGAVLSVPIEIPEGCHKLYAIVDLESQVRERDEKNNRSEQFTICSNAAMAQ